MLRKSVLNTFAISLSPAKLTLYLIPKDRKGLLTFQHIDNTFHCKELAIALWYQWALGRGNSVGSKHLPGVLSRNSLTLLRTVLELEEAGGRPYNKSEA
jgi:hypothetical protein